LKKRISSEQRCSAFNEKGLPFGNPFSLLAERLSIGFAATALISFADRHPKVCLSLVVELFSQSSNLFSAFQ